MQCDARLKVDNGDPWPKSLPRDHPYKNGIRTGDETRGGVIRQIAFNDSHFKITRA